MKILVLGASGMLGSAIVRTLSHDDQLEVYGTVRSAAGKNFFSAEIAGRLIDNIDVEHFDSLVQVHSKVRPDVVINCIGLVKQVADADNPLNAIPINTMLPHRLANLCKLGNARLIHISTDCVFNGKKGGYRDFDVSDATDLYGKSKFLGEVDYENAITLRTSIIGHELHTSHGLIEWFLAQEGNCSGYTNAIFSGLPTVVLAAVIRDHVLPNPSLHGVYQVAAKPISKYELLTLVAKIYRKKITINPSDALVVDRSLDASRFRDATGFLAPEWPELIEAMYLTREGDAIV